VNLRGEVLLTASARFPKDRSGLVACGNQNCTATPLFFLLSKRPTACCWLHLPKPRLAESHAAVIIPPDHRVLRTEMWKQPKSVVAVLMLSALATDEA
jgi:hypothetical protein